MIMGFVTQFAQRFTPITPSDVTVLKVPSVVRVANKGATWDTVTVTPSHNSPGSTQGLTPVAFDIAPNSVDYIPFQVSQVRATGTNAGGNLTIGALHDSVIY